MLPANKMSDFIATAWADLGIDPDLLSQRNLTLFEEASELVDVAVAADGRIWQMTPTAAEHWLAMQSAALADGINIRIASAYRPSSRQCELIKESYWQGRRSVQFCRYWLRPAAVSIIPAVPLIFLNPVARWWKKPLKPRRPMAG